MPLASEYIAIGGRVIARDLSRKEWDSIHKRVNAFQTDFAKLVRKYIPVTPDESDNPEFYEQLRGMMQDSTSVFNPHVWSEEFKPKKFSKAPKRVVVPFAVRFNKLVDLGNKIGREYRNLKESTLVSYLTMLMDDLRSVLGEAKLEYEEGNEETWRHISLAVSGVYKQYGYKSETSLEESVNEARWHVVMHTLNTVNAVWPEFSKILTLEGALTVKLRRINIPNDHR
jgi:hypothetical protein